MKYLYKAVICYELNGMRVAQHLNKWHYGEIPEEETKEYSFDDLIDECGFTSMFTLFKNKYYAVRLNNSTTIIKRKAFKSASRTISYVKIPVGMMTTSALIEKLSIIELAELCKDNNLILPLTK